ncbi:restriction endonuclease subunit S [Vibrio sp. 811]|uniref:restriction endonuclease subunit S n=1 Tax=Vibrio sp. 811 TaxID=3074616 RepID=UPI002965683B|nr:restriction endonuclease subunit S [Vibrio sp. 811]MDW1986720.1 restriction endonuclease subunit S [Vibrio sp. 811]
MLKKSPYTLKKIGPLIDLLSGFAFKSNEFSDVATTEQHIRLLRGINITENAIRNNDTIDKFWFNSSTDLDKYYLKEGDLVISMDGSKVGRNYALVSPKDLPSLLVQRVARIRAKEGLHLPFLHQLIGSKIFTNYVDSVKTSSGIPHISAKQIKEFSIPLPNIAIQQKIAEILSTVDKKIDLIDQKIAETEKLKTGLMQKLFSKGVGVQDENGEWQPHTDYETLEGSKIPKGWLKTTLSQVIKVKSGDSLSKKNMKEGCIPVFGGNGISGYHSKANFNSPQLVIGRVGEYCGAVHITPEKSWITDNALLITETLINVSFEFLYYLLVSVDLNKYASRNAQPLVSGRTLNLVTVKVPQEAEQYEIVNILSTVDRKLILLNRQIEETRRLKKGLMQKLLTGEWRVPVEETEAA